MQTTGGRIQKEENQTLSCKELAQKVIVEIRLPVNKIIHLFNFISGTTEKPVIKINSRRGGLPQRLVEIREFERQNDRVEVTPCLSLRPDW